MSYRIGLIGMVAKELEADRWGTLQRLAEVGYQGIEGGFLAGATAAETADNRARLEALGMHCIALNCSHYKEEQLPETMAKAKALGAPFIVDYWAAPETHDELMLLCEQFERMALACAKEGLRFIYHNHEHEFTPRFGEKHNESMFDILFNNTEALRFELDIAWCHFGGSDPVRVIRRCGKRIPVLHVKDFSDDSVRGHFCAVGCGTVPCFAAIEAAAAKGCEWMVVEQDKPGRLSHYESAIASMYNLREVGLHPQRGLHQA